MSKTARISGWVLSVLITVFLILVSASGKFTDWEGKEEMFAKFGFTTQKMAAIGVVEVIVALLILIPRLSFIGGILLTAYLGGATVTHVRVDDPYYMPIVMGVLLWIALGLREPEIFRLAFGVPRRTTTPQLPITP
jgi:uncharacterized membrane protein YphA (DoxX/SURF4 family)